MGIRKDARYFSVMAVVAASMLCAGVTARAQDATATNAPATGTNDISAPDSSPAPSPFETKVRKNDIGVTGDFMYGQGTITLPVGYSLAKALPGGGLQPQVTTATRSTVYYGGTVSYSYGRFLYLDLSYENGSSTGAQTIDINNTLLGAGPGHFSTSFDYSDDWYQLYLRYNFQNWKWLAHSPFKAYLRGGVSLVDATLTANSPLYSQHDDTTDVVGNLGFGLYYQIHSWSHVKLGLQVEGEASYGNRSQTSTESLSEDVGLGATSAKINNTLYGGIGRGTVHVEWRVGHSNWRVIGDVGVQAKYTIINYPNGGGSPNEYLYGPYAKIGASFVF